VNAVIVRRSVADVRRPLFGWMLGLVGMVLMGVSMGAMNAAVSSSSPSPMANGL